MAGLIKKSITIEKGDHKIGIIGYIGADADVINICSLYVL